MSGAPAAPDAPGSQRAGGRSAGLFVWRYCCRVGHGSGSAPRLSRFRAKRGPVRVKKTRQAKKPEPFTVSMKAHVHYWNTDSRWWRWVCKRAVVCSGMKPSVSRSMLSGQTLARSGGRNGAGGDASPATSGASRSPSLSPQAACPAPKWQRSMTWSSRLAPGNC